MGGGGGRAGLSSVINPTFLRPEAVPQPPMRAHRGGCLSHEPVCWSGPSAALLAGGGGRSRTDVAQGTLSTRALPGAPTITPPVRGALAGPPKNQSPRTVRKICRLLVG